MPRPGPRPYECVRRAWHSDRHQPMRGSLIQEIFRVVSEAHSPATRRNREWQEKLPCVVLKAEEIMYSKANSEAEYMDPKTLWSRAVDAIDTIIRRDDANESQDLLQPCIEAALNLGCTPRRASRSQRHSNPGCYLSFNASRDVSAAVPNNKVTDQNKMHHLGSSATLLPQLPCHSTDLHNSSSPLYTTLLGPCATSSACRGIESMSLNTSSELKDSCANSMPEYPFAGNSSFLNWQPAGLSTSVDSCALSSYGRVYPLYYGQPQFRTAPHQCGQNAQDAICNTVTAVDTSLLPFGQVEMDFLHNFLGSSPAVDSRGRGSRLEEHSVRPSYPACSLSLGLGLPLGSTLSAENAWAHRFENLASDDSCEGKSSCY